MPDENTSHSSEGGTDGNIPYEQDARADNSAKGDFRKIETGQRIAPAKKPYNILYRHYTDRLSSFKSLQKSMKQSPEDLAATGLYYRGKGDECQCYVCGGILHDWDDDDIPMEEHKTIFPECALVLQLNDNYSPSITDQQPVQHQLDFRSDNSKSDLRKIETEQPLAPIQKPHSIQYQSFTDRLDTFHSLQKSMKQLPKDLAEAGLYYTGEEDKCRCYMCGVVLHQWEDDDIPMEEHKKSSPECLLVLAT